MLKSEGGFSAIRFAGIAFAALVAVSSGAAMAQDDRPFTIAVVDLDAVVANSPAGVSWRGIWKTFRTLSRRKSSVARPRRNPFSGK